MIEMAIPRTRPGKYPAVLSYGFRPFFLLGALHAGASIVFWLPLFYGVVETASVFTPVDWHIHEMLFGYLAAIVTGFLLTAIPNWTGRLPVQGLPLLGLVILWLAGRVAVAFSSKIGWSAAAIIDCAFLLAVALAAATEIVAGRNWRNLKVVVPVSVLFVANAVFHLEAQYQGVSDISRRLGMAAAIVLITVIGGRIIPSFTRNWLVRENPGRLPVPFNSLDTTIIIVSALALAAWTFAPGLAATGWVMICASGLNLVRLSRWAGDRTLKDPLVMVLHVAYLFIPFGFLLGGLQVLLPGVFVPAAGLHAFGVGAIGSMTLAVMTRATLGHTGRELHAGSGTCTIYVFVALAALVRVAAAFLPDMSVLVDTSAALWALAFLGYVAIFGAMLVKPKWARR